MSTPCKASAISCTTKGDTVERAPIHKISTPASKAASTCLALATSTADFNPCFLAAATSQGKAPSPIPIKEPGRVRGFQMPPLKICTWCWAKAAAVCSIWLSDSTLQGPEISTILAAGNPHSLKPAIAVFTVIICLQINIYKTEIKAIIGFIF